MTAERVEVFPSWAAAKIFTELVMIRQSVRSSRPSLTPTVCPLFISPFSAHLQPNPRSRLTSFLLALKPCLSFARYKNPDVIELVSETSQAYQSICAYSHTCSHTCHTCILKDIPKSSPRYSCSDYAKSTRRRSGNHIKRSIVKHYIAYKYI